MISLPFNLPCGTTDSDEWVAGDTGITAREQRPLFRAIGKLPKRGKGAAICAAVGGPLGALAKEPIGGVIGGPR